MKADLHMHSIYSDGKLSPIELIKRAKESKVDVCFLTDHDCILGSEEYIKCAKENGIISYPAFEFSTYLNNESIHVLGMFKDIESIPNDFKEYLASIKYIRQERMKKMVDNCNRLFNMDIDYEEVKALQENMLERPHLAEVISKKYNITQKEVFDTYLSNDSPAYIPANKISTIEGIDMIHKAGGIAILAHPYIYKKNDPMDLVKLPFDGVEVFYFATKKSKYKPMLKYCKKNNLLITGGSDFHKDQDYKHANVGSGFYGSPHVEKIIEKLNSL